MKFDDIIEFLKRLLPSNYYTNPNYYKHYKIPPFKNIKIQIKDFKISNSVLKNIEK